MMGGANRRLTSTVVAVLALLLASGVSDPSPLHAQRVVAQSGDLTLDLGGYARNLAGLYHLGYDVPGQDRTSAFDAQVLRLKWGARLGDRAVLNVHDRMQFQASSEARSLGNSVAGFGVSALPGRSVNLRTSIVDRDRVQAWHDVDRLALTVYTGAGDITVGRQAITWGISNLFPVADLWAQFSPFELDTEEKPGIDAVRWLFYPRAGWEVDAVMADRGSSGDLSAGVRASVTLPWADVHLAGGKFWNQALAMAGVSAPVGAWKLRAEGVLPYDLDRDDFTRVRATVGADWLHGEWVVSGEVHLNGIGAPDASGYGAVLQDPRFIRGESYYLGRHYLGAVVNYAPGNDRLSFTLNAMMNLQDPSAAVTPVVTYDLGQSVRLSAGGLWAVGRRPDMTGVLPAFRSEYGAYGSLLFTRMSWYF